MESHARKGEGKQNELSLPSLEIDCHKRVTTPSFSRSYMEHVEYTIRSTAGKLKA